MHKKGLRALNCLPTTSFRLSISLSLTISLYLSGYVSSPLTLSLLSSLALSGSLHVIDDHQICAFYAQLKAEMCGVAAMWRCIVQPIVAHRCGKSNLLPMAEGRLAAQGWGVANERQRCYCCLCLLPSASAFYLLPPASCHCLCLLPLPSAAFVLIYAQAATSKRVTKWTEVEARLSLGLGFGLGN